MQLDFFLDKLKVFCLCKIVYACHMVISSLYLPLLFINNKQIKKNQPIYTVYAFYEKINHIKIFYSEAEMIFS